MSVNDGENVELRLVRVSERLERSTDQLERILAQLREEFLSYGQDSTTEPIPEDQGDDNADGTDGTETQNSNT